MPLRFPALAARRRAGGLLLVAATLLATAAVTAAGQDPAPRDPAPRDAVAEAYLLFADGLRAARERDFDAARAAYRRAAELDPASAAPLVALAGLDASSGDAESAERRAREAVARDPEYAAAHRMLGQVLAFRYSRSEGDQALAEGAIQAFGETVRLAPDDVASRDALARLLIAARREEEAADQLRELVRRSPDAYDALATLARLRLAAGDLEQAFQYLAQSLRIEPRQIEVRQRLDQLLTREIPGVSRQEALERVAELYETAAKSHPEDLELRLSLADALARLGRLPEAAAAFERVLASDPDHEDALLGLSVIRAQQLRLDEAEPLLERLVAINPRGVPARLMLGQVFSTRCEFDRAARAFEQLVDMPRDAYGTARRREALVRLSEARESLGEADAARAALEQAARLAEGTGDETRFRAALIRNRLTAGEPDEALRMVEALLGERPGDPGLLSLRASALREADRADEALAILVGLQEKHPEEPGVAHAIVRHHIETGDFARAEENVRTWLEARPEDLLFRFQLGAVLEQQDRFEDAEAAFRQVIDADPEHHLALNYLGYMLADRTDRLAEAEDLIRRALDEDPWSGSYRDSLGWVQFRRGQVEDAEPHLLHAYRCMPENAVVLDHLGDLYRARADVEQALRFWRLALRHDDGGELSRDEVVRKIEEAGDGRE